MATYGLECWGADGTQTLEISDRITRLFDIRTLTGGTSGTFNISGDFTDVSTSNVVCLEYCLENNKVPIKATVNSVTSTTITIGYTALTVGVSPNEIPSGDTVFVTMGW